MLLSFFIRPFHDWDSQMYSLAGALKGHDGPVNALSFNNNGSLLASGGNFEFGSTDGFSPQFTAGDDEQVRIWDMSTFRQCQNLVNPEGRWGQITCLKFINFETPSTADWLCFGTGRGIIALYCKSRRAAEFAEVWNLSVFGAGDSVEALAFDPGHQRLAVGSHYGQIKVFRYQNGNITELWSDELRDAIPRAILFADSGRSLNIFTLESGTVICRDAETSAAIGTRHLRTAIGHVSQCQATGNYLVDNMRDGFDLYASNRVGPVRTYRVEASKMFVKAGIFCEGGKVVACGSDHGRMYVFASGEEHAKQELVHGKRKDLVQTVEATTANGFHILVSGASSGNYDIYVWKKPVKGHSNNREKRQLLETLVVMNLVFLIGFLWTTRESWSNSVKARYLQVSAAVLGPSTARETREVLHQKAFVYQHYQQEKEGSARQIIRIPPSVSSDD